jgi:hypothetical protein
MICVRIEIASFRFPDPVCQASDRSTRTVHLMYLCCICSTRLKFSKITHLQICLITIGQLLLT